MSDVYRARERHVLQQLAWQTLNDPKAGAADKRAARERLERRAAGLDDDPDLASYTLDELRQLDAIETARAARLAAPLK